MHRGGFTLLELLIVLVLIGLTAAVVAPRLSGTHDKLPLGTAAKHLSALMRLARSNAVTRGQTVVVYAEPETSRIVMAAATNRAHADQINENKKEASGSVALIDPRHAYHLPRGITLSRVVSEGGMRLEDAAIALFYPIGNSSGGQVVLTDAAGRRKIITIDTITGLVTIGS
jgi:type II secretion system protein H